MKKLYTLVFISFTFFLTSCNDNVYPRPRGNVRLEYPEAKYSLYHSNELKISFEKSNYTNITKMKKNWINLEYPKMKAKLHLTHLDVNNNIKKLISDVHKLTDEHKIKASGIIPHAYSNPEEHVYGVMYEIIGNSASNIQFYVTDSVSNLISGSLYFRAKPNADSLNPAIQYIKKDIITLLETLRWESNY
jgi:gliding motility-associated lipoprotein GldD